MPFLFLLCCFAFTERGNHPLTPQYQSRDFAGMVKLNTFTISGCNLHAEFTGYYTWGSTPFWPRIIFPEIQIRDPQRITVHLLDKSWDSTCSQLVFLLVVRIPQECLFLPLDPRDTYPQGFRFCILNLAAL